MTPTPPPGPTNPRRRLTEPPAAASLFEVVTDPYATAAARTTAADVVTAHFEPMVWDLVEACGADPDAVTPQVLRNLRRMLERRPFLCLRPAMLWDPTRGFAPRVARLTRNAVIDHSRKTLLYDFQSLFSDSPGRTHDPHGGGNGSSGSIVFAGDSITELFSSPALRMPDLNRLEQALALRAALWRTEAENRRLLYSTKALGWSGKDGIADLSAPAPAPHTPGVVAPVASSGPRSVTSVTSLTSRFKRAARKFQQRLPGTARALWEVRFGAVPEFARDLYVAVLVGLGREGRVGSEFLTRVAAGATPGAAAAASRVPPRVIQDWLRGRLTRGLPDDVPPAIRPALEPLAARLGTTTTAGEVTAVATELGGLLAGWYADARLRAYFLQGWAGDRLTRFDAHVLSRLRALTANRLVVERLSRRDGTGGRVGPIAAALAPLGARALLIVRWQYLDGKEVKELCRATGLDALAVQAVLKPFRPLIPK
ncbi:MAG: hypothetical protein U0804_17805 [Gemmataceae bacterium]